jgi:hypothetical protein
MKKLVPIILAAKTIVLAVWLARRHFRPGRV